MNVTKLNNIKYHSYTTAFISAIEPSLCSGHLENVRGNNHSMPTTASNTCKCRVTIGSYDLYTFTFITDVEESGYSPRVCISPIRRTKFSPLSKTVCIRGRGQRAQLCCTPFICLQPLIDRDGVYKVKFVGECPW